MGVWIETGTSVALSTVGPVTPCVGVWIETYVASYVNSLCSVTPCVGVWIETLGYNLRYWQWSHTLRGCVD